MATRERFYEESSFFLATESRFDAVHIRIEAAGVLFARHNYNLDIYYFLAHTYNQNSYAFIKLCAVSGRFDTLFAPVS